MIGGVVATFIDEYVPRKKQQRIVTFVQDLSRDFEAERDRIDQEYVRTADFERMVEDVLDRVQAVRNEDKFLVTGRRCSPACRRRIGRRPPTGTG